MVVARLAVKPVWAWASILLVAGMGLHESVAGGQQAAPEVPVIRSTSTLVFLDVTVLDKQGKPVVKGLTQDDFTITEDKKPQRIFSFEAPEVHVLGPHARDANPDGKAPVTILVLDQLDSNFEDFAYLSYSMKQYLDSQPERLAAPAELMLVGNNSLELLQGFTRSREDLLAALQQMPSSLPYIDTPGGFLADRFVKAIAALQEIALQNRGVPGRKNIVWVGHGGPGMNTWGMADSLVAKLKKFAHGTTNALVDARISLFVVYPGLPVKGGIFNLSEGDAQLKLGDDDPFAGDINFGLFVNETGGALFHNRNDVDALIARSQEMGSEYFTLTYQPRDGDDDGAFRRIRVDLRDPNLHAVTKAGYYAQDAKEPVDPQEETIVNLAQATRSTVPFDGLDVQIGDVVRHPDTRTAEITVVIRSKNLEWLPIEDGQSQISLFMSAASLAGDRTIEASKVEKVTLTAISQDKKALANQVIREKIAIRVPKNTRTVRIAVETDEQGRIGAANVDRKKIDAAPATPTPEPTVVARPMASRGQE